MSSKGALVVIGSGPGIGRATACRFAEQGFQHIVLLSRDATRLSEDAKAVKSAASTVNVEILQIDLAAEEASVRNALSEVDAKLKAAGTPLEVVHYNAARVGPSKVLEWEAKSLEEDLKVFPAHVTVTTCTPTDKLQITTVSLYITLQWAVPHLVETAKSPTHNPAFLVTSGLLYRDPYPVLFSLSVGKAAQHNLIQSFHKKYEPHIHVACVPVGGSVSDEAKVTTARAVAEQFWKLYEQPKGTEGKGSVEMYEPGYEAGIEQIRKAVEGE